MHSVNWLYTFSGFCVGMLVGMTGVGGGSLMTPLLILLFGIHPASAVGTDLLFAAGTKTAGATVHGANRVVDWRLVRSLASGSVPAAAVTLLILSQFNLAGRATQHFLSVALGTALVVTAATVILRPHIVAWFARWVGEPHAATARTLTVATGALLGCLVSLTSVGAGALGVTALVLLYPRLPTARIVATDIAHAVPLTLVAGAGHLLLSSVDIRVLGLLLLGSLPGIFIGSQLAIRVPDTILRLALSGVLVIVGGRLIL
ncbi:MAG TPA: sulfite exporter TauE/SafE family protein [Stellaceae bacterium]|nr:sulfite exporter TauE/SafE family protein [Stellaceae bacterium]